VVRALLDAFDTLELIVTIDSMKMPDLFDVYLGRCHRHRRRRSTRLLSSMEQEV
jgi:hypothetical protein